MSVATFPNSGPVEVVGRLTLQLVESTGDLALFGLRTVRSLLGRMPRRSVLFPSMYQIGVRSLSVVMITGTFIGMVLAAQSYNQFRLMHLESRLGAVITMTLVTELGPVLAATMLAGRVGSAIAAELGTMRVTEQIDALRALGADPVNYLVVPRFLGCFLLIPLLTAIADGMGILGGWVLSTRLLGINNYHYWNYAIAYVTAYDVMHGLVKSVFFGAAIAVISCHRGFHCGAGAEGVGRAATSAFVASFVVILMLDLILGVLINNVYYVIWPGAISLV